MFPDNPFLPHHDTDWQRVSFKPKPVSAGTIHDAILEVMRRRPSGVISDDIKGSMPDFNWFSVRKRVNRMLTSGELVRTGETRRGSNGARQYVIALREQ